MTKNLNYYVEGRLFEWTMALATLTCGIEFIIWPEALEESAFRFLLLTMTRYEVMFALVCVGWSRMAALMLNGQTMFGLRLGPWVRAVCCVLSATMWVQFAIALSILSYSRGLPSPGLPFWIMFTLAELYAAYLAVKNG